MTIEMMEEKAVDCLIRAINAENTGMSLMAKGYRLQAIAIMERVELLQS